MKFPGADKARWLLLAALLALLPTCVFAGKIYVHWGHPRVCCCVPHHRYGHDTPREIGVVVARATERDPRQPKIFFPEVRSIEVGAVNLTDLGLALWPDGRLVATGRVSHAGGPDGDLQGSNVLIRVRALLNPRGVREPLVDPILIAQTERRYWVSRGSTDVISLLPAQRQPRQLLNTHFAEITHVELQLDTLKDR